MAMTARLTKITDAAVARETAIKEWQWRSAEEKTLAFNEAQGLEWAREEIGRIEILVLAAMANGETKIESVIFIPRSICRMPAIVEATTNDWYEIRSFWVRNPERMILIAFEKEGRIPALYKRNALVTFRERYDRESKTFGFMVDISWE